MVSGFLQPWTTAPLKFDGVSVQAQSSDICERNPGDYELERSRQVAEQIIRPTGLVDPFVEVRPTEHQIDDLMERIRQTVGKGYRSAGYHPDDQAYG